MGLPIRKPTAPGYTVSEYLSLERTSENRHYYRDGAIIAMAGESGPDGDISANTVGSLVAQLKGTPCRARTKDTKVCSGPIFTSGETRRGLFSYPDVLVICGETEYHDGTIRK